MSILSSAPGPAMDAYRVAHKQARRCAAQLHLDHRAKRVASIGEALTTHTRRWIASEIAAHAAAYGFAFADVCHAIATATPSDPTWAMLQQYDRIARGLAKAGGPRLTGRDLLRSIDQPDGAWDGRCRVCSSCIKEARQ